MEFIKQLIVLILTVSPFCYPLNMDFHHLKTIWLKSMDFHHREIFDWILTEYRYISLNNIWLKLTQYGHISYKKYLTENSLNISQVRISVSPCWPAMEILRPYPEHILYKLASACICIKYLRHGLSNWLTAISSVNLQDNATAHTLSRA